MIPTTAETIIFTINAAIKLSQNLRKAFAQSIRAKSLVLPLPDFGSNIGLEAINAFFNEHQEYFEGLPALKALFDHAMDVSKLPGAEMEEYKEYYFSFKAINKGDTGESKLDEVELVSLLKIRQWEKGKSPASVLQLVAGTLVEVGVDYFAQVPGALNRESQQGRIMVKFLDAFSGISLAENPAITKELSTKVVPRLFSAATETFRELSPQITDDPKVQAFIHVATQGIAQDIFKRTEQMDAGRQDEAIHWGRFILSSMIRNAGNYVFTAPETILGANQQVSGIIKSSGLTLLEAILDDESDKIILRNALSPNTLDEITKATLNIIAEHPQLISGERGIKEIISSIAKLAQENHVADKGFVPELIRIVLEQSAGKLEMLWREKPTGPEHLLIVATSQILQALATKPGESTPWKASLSKTQLLGIVDELVGTVANNPDWILAEVRGQSLLSEVLQAVFSAIQKIPPRQRLAPASIQSILRTGMQMALANRKILDRIKWGTEEEETSILHKSLDLVFGLTFPKDAAAELSRLKLLSDLLAYISNVLLRQHPNENGLILLDLILFKSEVDYTQGWEPKLADELLNAVLAVTAKQPELLAKPESLQIVIAGVAAAIKDAQIKEPGFSTRLLQQMLRQTAQHTHLLVKGDEGKPQHLLIVALNQVILALSANDKRGNWKPQIDAGFVPQLIEELLDVVAQYPMWVTQRAAQSSLLSEVLNTALRAMASIPKKERLSKPVLTQVLKLSLLVTAAHPSLLQKIKFAEDEQEKEILQRSLELVFAYLFDTKVEEVERKLLQEDLIRYVLEVLMSRLPNSTGLLLLRLILGKNGGINLAQGVKKASLDQLIDDFLAMLAQHPELSKHDQALQEVISSMAALLQEINFDQPGLLPAIIRLMLNHLSKHLELILDGNRPHSRHLYFLAGFQVLQALAQPVQDGQWKPQLSNEQIVTILEIIFNKVSENSQWLQDEPLIFALLQAIFRALDQLPASLPVPFKLLHKLVQESMQASTHQRRLLTSIEGHGGKMQVCLQYALAEFFRLVFQGNWKTEMAWRLSQFEISAKLLDQFLMAIAASAAGKVDIDAILEQIRKAIETWEEDFSLSLDLILNQINLPSPQ